MTPDDKLRPPVDEDTDGRPITSDRGTPLDFERIDQDARSYKECFRSLLKVDIDSDDSQRNEHLAQWIVTRWRGWDLIHPEEVRRMMSVLRDAHGLVRLIARAMDGDLHAQAALKRAASEATRALSLQPSLTDIERRRVQLLEELDETRRWMKRCAELRESEALDVDTELRQCAVEVRKCDPLLICSETAFMTAALREACEATTAPCRTAAKFAYAVDMFGDRREFRCEACLETKHPCAKCKKRNPDPVSAIEARFWRAWQKHGSQEVNTEQQVVKK